MSDLFDRLVEPLIGREGGYVNHKSDPGKATIWGITQETARRFGYGGSMQAMPRQTAVAIYRKQYWSGPGFDGLAAFSPEVAEEVFDTGVNMGPKVASEFLQRLLNALNRQGRDYPDIAVDGDVGPATLHALKAYLDKRGKEGVSVLLKGLNALQGAQYVKIAEGRQASEDFLYGWLRARVA